MEYPIDLLQADDEAALIDCVQATFPAPQGEVMARMLDLTPPRYLAYTRLVCAKAVRDGLTMVARAPDGSIAGFCINEDFATAPRYREAAIDEAMHPLIALLDDLDRFAHPQSVKPGEVFHFYMLGVRREYQRSRLGIALAARSLELAAARGYAHTLAEATGVGSQRLVAELGFQTVAEIPYQEFVYQGKSVFAAIAAPRGCRLVERAVGSVNQGTRHEEHRAGEQHRRGQGEHPSE